MALKFNPITILIIFIFCYPLLVGFLTKYSSDNLKRDVLNVGDSISFILSLISSLYLVRRIFVQHEGGIYKTIYEKIPSALTSIIESSPLILYLVVLPIIILIVYKLIGLLIRFIFSIAVFPILDGIENKLRQKNDFTRRFFGVLFQLPKACCYVLFLIFILNLISIFNVNSNINEYLEASEPYNKLCQQFVVPIMQSKISKQLPNIINNSFKIVSKDAVPYTDGKGGSGSSGKTIVYYNGVTLDEGVKSDSEIDSFARRLVKGCSSDTQKAKIIYEWIGSNIKYDDNEANAVMADSYGVKSGAINAFNTRKGICFDYSCLYVAMCRAVGLRVRLITGEGFNGMTWVSHAWNQVYIPESGKWINVDTTFASAGDYFNSSQFRYDHRNSSVAGEW